MDEESAYKSVNVHPLANLHDLDVVQVLTAAPGHACRPTSAALAADLPAGRSTGPSGNTGEQLAFTGGG